MQRVFLIHGWTGSPEVDWFPWAKKTLSDNGYEVFAPEMPDTDHPKIAAWAGKIKEVVGKPRANDIFVGHSIGAQAVERYLQTLPENTKVGKVILIAPWMVLTPQAFEDLEEERETIREWYEKPIEYEKIKKMAGSWKAVFSDDDPYVIYEDNYKIYEDKLGAKIILKHGQQHFSREGGVTEIPFLLELLK